MLEANDSQLNALIRVVDPENFSLLAHKPGYLLCFDNKENTVVDKPHFFNKLLGGKDRFVHYFVKQLEKPLAIKDWKFRWADGASQIELDFSASFGIKVDDEEGARTLVKILHRAEGPAKALYGLIDKKLHERVGANVGQSLQTGGDLLGRLLGGKQNNGQELLVHETINRDLSTNIAEKIGGQFSISFIIKNLPKQQLQIEKHRTEFNIPEIHEGRMIETSVHLQLSNYQNFKRAGIVDDNDAIIRIKKFIDDAVRNFIFGKSYYEIAQQFENKIQIAIEEYVKEQALTIGYSVKLFQTLPNIGVLALTHGMRVELAADQYEFQTKYGGVKVKMDVAIMLTAIDFNLVANLIEAGMTVPRIYERLQARLEQICRDEISRIDRKEFNLKFEPVRGVPFSVGGDTVAERLNDAMIRVFEMQYGLKIDVINISQAQTEEGERFTDILGKATPFTLNISAQAEHGLRDKILVDGMFEVIAIDPEDWDKFQNKDFGYAKKSKYWDAERVAALKRDLSELLGSYSEEEFEKQRKAKAVRNELAQIGERITSLLENFISKMPEVANRSRTVADIHALWEMSEKFAYQKIKDEFGLEIAFREFNRKDTVTERNNAEIFELKQMDVVNRAKQDLARGNEIAALVHQEDLAYLEKLKRLQQDQLEKNDYDEKTIEEKIIEKTKMSDWHAVQPEESKAVMEPTVIDRKNLPLLGQEFADLIKEKDQK